MINLLSDASIDTVVYEGSSNFYKTTQTLQKKFTSNPNETTKSSKINESVKTSFVKNKEIKVPRKQKEVAGAKSTLPNIAKKEGLKQPTRRKDKQQAQNKNSSNDQSDLESKIVTQVLNNRSKNLQRDVRSQGALFPNSKDSAVLHKERRDKIYKEQHLKKSSESQNSGSTPSISALSKKHKIIMEPTSDQLRNSFAPTNGFENIIGSKNKEGYKNSRIAELAMTPLKNIDIVLDNEPQSDALKELIMATEINENCKDVTAKPITTKGGKQEKLKSLLTNDLTSEHKSQILQKGKLKTKGVTKKETSTKELQAGMLVT